MYIHVHTVHILRMQFKALYAKNQKFGHVSKQYVCPFFRICGFAVTFFEITFILNKCVCCKYVSIFLCNQIIERSALNCFRIHNLHWHVHKQVDVKKQEQM